MSLESSMVDKDVDEDLVNDQFACLRLHLKVVLSLHKDLLLNAK